MTSGLGLFSNLGSGSTISNLTLANANVSAISGTTYVGALVGQSQGPASARAMISNVSVGGTVSVTNGTYIGGVVGYMAGAGGLDNVVSNASVSGYNNVGGIVGYLSSGAITNSVASGAVSGGASAQSIGGLVGNSYGSISASHATGAVSGGTYSYYIGGLVGYNNGAISNSYATGAVSAGLSSSYVGGLAGYNSGTLTTTYATGAVTVRDASNANNSTNISGNYIGGLAGYNTAAVSNSYSSGAVTGATNTAVLFGYNSSTSISNVFYNIDSSTVNGNSYVGPYGIYTAQFQDWTSHSLTLDIARYATLPFDSASGSYLISNLQGMKDLLGFAGTAGYKFKLTANVDLSTVAGYYIPVFTAASFDGGGNTLSNLNVNQPLVSNIGFIGTLGGASTLSNLVLTNLNVSGNTNVGGAVGTVLRPNATTISISNVSVAGTVTGTGNYVGGVAGYMNTYAGLNGVSSSATVQGASYVGGAAGYVDNATVTNSSATGNVACCSATT